MERIDRGDRVTIVRTQQRRGHLYAGRMAGHYVCRAGEEHWSAPATPESRRELAERLRSWATGHPHTIAWTANPTDLADAWESTRHRLYFEGQSAYGGVAATFERRDDGTVQVTDTLLNDWDPAGWMPPTDTERVLAEVDGRREFIDAMAARWHTEPLPQVIPRTAAD
jgi:hypothetical protein